MDRDRTLVMQAAVVQRYGEPNVVVIESVPRPQVVHPRDVVVRVQVTSVNSGDSRMRACRVPWGMGVLMRLALGWRRPGNGILGVECAGVIVDKGSAVSSFEVGQRVACFGDPFLYAHAEYVRIRENSKAVAIPDGLEASHAVATLFGGTTAMHYIRVAGIRAGESVLVLGATGSVGCALVQLCSKVHHAQVTAVCSGAGSDLARSLGAAAVVDYTTEDWRAPAAREQYNVIFDCCGTTSYAQAAPKLKSGGRFVRIDVPDIWGQIAAPFQGRLSGHRVIAGVCDVKRNDMASLVRMVADGVLTPVIDSIFSLTRIVEAHRRVDSGRKKGCVAVTIDSDQK
eukprot:c19148_g1_i1.p1 GENE.c19148_g1_i1~~c19148_g1_i1.p1  ORF type:complete len:341 (+),score=52.19 c19148_g1_i1:117-1139(+)